MIGASGQIGVELTHGLYVSQDDLDEGNLKYKVDFKNVYASILNKWLNTDDVAILGKKYDYLSFV